MKASDMGLCPGCSRTGAMSTLTALLLLLPLFTQANSVMGNGTEIASATNATSSLTDVAKLEEMSEASSVSPLFLILRSGRKPRGGEAEEGSGLHGQEGGGEEEEKELHPVTAAPQVTTVGEETPEISPDSAEENQFLPHEPSSEEEEEPRLHVVTESPWHRANDTVDNTVLDLDEHALPTTPSPSLAAPPSRHDILTVDFFDDDLPHGNEPVPPSPSAHELQGRDPTAWSMPENYGYRIPYSEGASPTSEEYSTTTETYEDELLFTTTTQPPLRPFRPVLPVGRESRPSPPRSVGVGDNGECRLGYVWHNGTCRSQCDTLPGYCYNGGQCYVLDGIGIFCRCNIQDYVWHKGARCESVITEFQVMCLAIGASALTLLLLFMIIVCFAKKLHVLKTENHKLRKRSSKYRGSSEQHNDNFSLSTIAEGSHPNKTMSRYTWECKSKQQAGCEDDPNAQNKLEEPVKAPPPKEDEALNIQNSLTPKHENHKMLGDENSEGRLTVDVELHLPKTAKILPPSSPLVHYDVYLYKAPRSPAPGRLRNRVRWEDRCNSSTYSHRPAPCSTSRPASTHSLSALNPGRSRHRPCTAVTCTP